MKKTVVLLGIALYSNAVFSHEPEFSDRTDLNHILAGYSERTGVKFVVDPRVKARVNMIGLKLDDVTQSNLVDILELHTFTAFEKDGVVYVLPRSAADSLDFQFDRKWGDQ